MHNLGWLGCRTKFFAYRDRFPRISIEQADLRPKKASILIWDKSDVSVSFLNRKDSHDALSMHAQVLLPFRYFFFHNNVPSYAFFVNILCLSRTWIKLKNPTFSFSNRLTILNTLHSVKNALKVICWHDLSLALWLLYSSRFVSNETDDYLDSTLEKETECFNTFTLRLAEIESTSKGVQ